MHYSTGVYSECTSVIKRRGNKCNNFSGIIHCECDRGLCGDSTSNSNNNGDGTDCNNNKAVIKFNSIQVYLHANLTAQRPIAKLARVHTNAQK
jgi:hypothetical protein